MKRIKKSREQFCSEDVENFRFFEEPTTSYDPVAELLLEWKDNEETSTEAAKASERNQQTERLFAITSEVLFQFAEKWRPPIHRDKPISSTAVNRIARMLVELKLKKPPVPKTIRKCFEHPDQFERPGAALVTRQLLCIALGKLSRRITIDGNDVAIPDAAALAKAVTASLNSEVTVSDLEDALAIALEVTRDRRVQESGKSGR